MKEIENAKPSKTSPSTVNLQKQSSDTSTTGVPGLTEQESISEVMTEESEPLVISKMDPDFSRVPAGEKTADSPPPPTVVQQTEDVVELNLPTSNAGSTLPESIAGTNLPAPTEGSNVPVHDQKLPYYPVGVQTVKIGSSNPFFMEFFQPFEVFPQFNRRQPLPPPEHHQQFPFRDSVNPFSDFIEPADPFVDPMRSPFFNQLVNAYTNEFKSKLCLIRNYLSKD